METLCHYFLLINSMLNSHGNILILVWREQGIRINPWAPSAFVVVNKSHHGWSFVRTIRYAPPKSIFQDWCNEGARVLVCRNVQISGWNDVFCMERSLLAQSAWGGDDLFIFRHAVIAYIVQLGSRAHHSVIGVGLFYRQFSHTFRVLWLLPSS